MGKFVSAVLVCLVGLLAGTAGARAQTSSDQAAIQAQYKHFIDAFNKKDPDGVMAVYAPEVFVFDVVPPRQYVGAAAYKKDWEDLFKTMSGPVTNTMVDLNITVVGSVAYAHYIDDGTLDVAGSPPVHTVVRSTDVWRKEKGKWLIVQEHNSFPVDLATGKADTLSKP